MGAIDRPSGDEVNSEISLHLLVKAFGGGVVGGPFEQVGVVARGASRAAGGVDDDRVEVVRVEHFHILAGELRGPALPTPSGNGSRGSKPRARAPRLHSHCAEAPARWPRWSRDTWRRPRSPETRRHEAAPGASGGKTSGRFEPPPDNFGSIACMRRKVLGQELRQTDPFGPVQQALASGTGGRNPRAARTRPL